MSDPAVNRWKQRGRICLWKHQQRHTNWNLAADDVACESLLDLLDRMKAGRWPSQKSVALVKPERTATHAPDRPALFATELILKYRKGEIAADFWMLESTGANTVMAILATSDYGTGAAIGLLLLIVWAFVLLFVVVALVMGIRAVKRGSSSQRKKRGVLLLLLSGIVPSCCYLGPPHLVRLGYGNYPVGRDAESQIKKGMTRDEVTAIVGTPHEQHDDVWYYWLDSFGIRYFRVFFDDEGRVTSTY
jgi:hypothetical protein